MKSTQQSTENKKKPKNQKTPTDILYRNTLQLKANSKNMLKVFLLPFSLVVAKYYFRAIKGTVTWLSHELSCY